jgi:transposase InsO family protein
VKFTFIERNHEEGYPVSLLCQNLRVSRSAYYAWKKRPAKIIGANELHLHRRAKELFRASRDSLGSRELCKKLRSEGFEIGREKTRRLMKKLRLRVIQRQAYRVTTKRKEGDEVADNLLNQNFNPMGPNEVWAGDITYLRTAEGWMYLAIVMDLYSRRIIGWATDRHMKQDLVIRALMMAYNLRRPGKGLVFHSDRGSQYTSRRYRQLLESYGMRASMGDVGACWDNAVVERFFGSLKHDWLFKVHQPTREFMKQDVVAYIKYYNLNRLHTSNGDMSPVQFENSQIKVSGLG